MASIRRLTTADLPRLKDFWTEHWGGEVMYMDGRAVCYDEVRGFVFEDWAGLVTYRIRGRECEITSIDSVQPARGIGTALIEAVITEAQANNCSRLFLTTTNDNLHALGFYQRRGFALAALRRDAVTESRSRKPTIPFIGENNIPLRDELELEMSLPSKDSDGKK
jgi:GNAT superfamily N-acetyltransferase